MKIKNYYTPKEYADIIGVTPQTVYKRVGDGEINCDRWGDRGYIKIPYTEIPTFIRQRMENKILSNIGETEEMKGK